MDQHVAEVDFTGGVWRAVYQQPDGRQDVLDDAGEPVFGVWFISPDEPRPCAVVDHTGD
jgi:hypothetical protein